MGGFLDDVGAEAVGFAEAERLLECAAAGGARVVDEGFVAKHCGGETLLFCTRVRGGENGDEGFGEEGGNVEAFDGVGVAEDAGVQCVVFEASDDTRGEGLVEMEADARVGFAEGTEDCGEGCEHAGADEADVEGADFAAADAAGLVDVALYGAEGTVGAFEEGFAGLGESDGAGGAGEERVAEEIFEAANLLREWGLGDVKPEGGAAEVEFLGYGDEVAEMAEFDILIHISNIIIGRNNILDVMVGKRETFVVR